MGRLIDDEAAVNALTILADKMDESGASVMQQAIDVLRAIEAYPEPQKMGEWKWDGKGTTVVCSQCGKGYDWYTDAQYYDYCPKCGVKMGGTE